MSTKPGKNESYGRNVWNRYWIYVLCEYCKEAMHEAYTKGDGLSYVPDRCNTANVSGMRCRDSRNIFQDTDCEEGNNRYPLSIDQVAKLKEENERLKI